MIVVDVNVLIYASLGSMDPQLAAMARSVRDKDRHWLLPALWRHEFMNVLCTMMRAGHLDTTQAENALRQALGNYEACEAPVELWRALELSAQTGLSGYDAQYLALAEHANCLLITADRRLAKASGGSAVVLEDYLAA